MQHTKYQNVVNCFFCGLFVFSMFDFACYPFSMGFSLSLISSYPALLHVYCCLYEVYSFIWFIFPARTIFPNRFFLRIRTNAISAKKAEQHIFIIINYSIIKSKWLECRYPNRSTGKLRCTWALSKSVAVVLVELEKTSDEPLSVTSNCQKNLTIKSSLIFNIEWMFY